jgi:hypothetical protein
MCGDHRHERSGQRHGENYYGIDTFLPDMLENTSQTRTGHKRQARANRSVDGHTHQGEKRNHNKTSSHPQQTGEKPCRSSYYKTFGQQHNHGQPRLTLKDIAAALGMLEPKADEASNVAGFGIPGRANR